MGELTHTIFVMKGSIPGQYRASDESLYYVYREVWERSRLLTTQNHGGYADKRDADARASEVKKDYTFD